MILINKGTETKIKLTIIEISKSWIIIKNNKYDKTAMNTRITG